MRLDDNPARSVAILSAIEPVSSLAVGVLVVPLRVASKSFITLPDRLLISA